MAQNPPLLKIENLVKSFSDNSVEVPVLDGISFELKIGEIVAILGPSGCGKTTLLNLIAGLDKDYQGSIHINKKNISSFGERLGYIFQDDTLLPWRSALKNAMLGAEINGGIKDFHHELVADLFRRFGLEEFIDHYPAQLSGGMRQRVSIIQALVLDPGLLLMDEPFSAVDYYNKLTIEDTLHSFLKEKNKSALLVTHDIEEAVAMSDRVLILSSRPATIIEEITVDFGIDRALLPPSKARGHKLSSSYYQSIWENLKESVIS